jgi:hypothetical protein
MSTAFRLYVEPGPAHGPVFDCLVAHDEASKAALLAAGCSLVFNIAQRPAG